VLDMLSEKPVKVSLRNYDNTSISVFAEFQVVNKDMDLKAVPALNEHPIIVNWLVEFMVGLELKKFPLPLQRSTETETNLSKAEEKKPRSKKKKKQTDL